MNAEEYCQEQAAGSGSSFYYSFLFLPAEQRQAITALYAFCREVDDIVDECSEQTVALVKLNWWREEIARIFHGQAQHPVGIALAKSIQKFNLEEKHFYSIIEGMLMDTQQSRYQDFDALSTYCYRVAGVVGLLAIEIFGYKNQATKEYAEKLGLAFQLTNILRDVHEDATRDRIYLPLDELERFHVSEQDLLNGKMTDNVRELFAFQTKRAEKCYQEAYQLLPTEDRFSQRGGLVMAAIYHALLERIQKINYNVLNNSIRLSPLRKLWIAWRAYRNEVKLNKASSAP
ncbi:MAG: presqualene diphosphate synthase HpnD [Sulfuriflexus sp.]|nr:presqualene diphosphate synthase HpnD [Sulfuriflexus sp.]